MVKEVERKLNRSWEGGGVEKKSFLAAMSSSRSDGVTQSVRPFVRTQGVSFKPKENL